MLVDAFVTDIFSMEVFSMAVNEWPQIFETTDKQEAILAMESGVYRAPEYDRDLHKYVFIKRMQKKVD